MLKSGSILGLILLVLGGSFIWYFNSPTSEGVLQELINTKPEEVKPAPITEIRNQPAATVPLPGMKVYRNEEFGLEFQYPREWTVSEERDTNPYNKFKVAVTPQVYQYFQPFYVIYSAKEHADQLTNNSRALGREIIDISVGGRPAIRYEYDLEEIHHTTIIIPFSEERSFIIGNERNENVAEFEQILASFRFLE